MMKTKIRVRTGSRNESLAYAAQVAAAPYGNAKADAASLALPDGTPEACRVEFNRDTGDVLLNRDGSPRICAPWLLCGIFGA